MKARLIMYKDNLQLLLCTGKIKTLTDAEAYEFLLHYDNQELYKGKEKWDYENLTMEEYSGDTIAVVNDDGNLITYNAEKFRHILGCKQINYITVSEYALKHNKKISIVRRCCQNGRISGAMRKGNTWIIPADSPYPADERLKH